MTSSWRHPALEFFSPGFSTTGFPISHKRAKSIFWPKNSYCILSLCNMEVTWSVLSWLLDFLEKLRKIVIFFSTSWPNWFPNLPMHGQNVIILAHFSLTKNTLKRPSFWTKKQILFLITCRRDLQRLKSTVTRWEKRVRQHPSEQIIRLIACSCTCLYSRQNARALSANSGAKVMSSRGRQKLGGDRACLFKKYFCFRQAYKAFKI